MNAVRTHEISRGSLLRLRWKVAQLAVQCHEQLVDRNAVTVLPPRKQREVYAEVFKFVGQRAGEEWPRHSWPFLERLNGIAALLVNLADVDEKWFRGTWPAFVIHDTNALSELAHKFDSPAPLPVPQLVRVETLGALTDKGLSDRQIALAWNWIGATGYGDGRRVARVRRGEEQAPGAIEVPGLADGLPTTQPSLDAVSAICDCLPSV